MCIHGLLGRYAWQSLIISPNYTGKTPPNYLWLIQPFQWMQKRGRSLARFASNILELVRKGECKYLHGFRKYQESRDTLFLRQHCMYHIIYYCSPSYGPTKTCFRSQPCTIECGHFTHFVGYTAYFKKGTPCRLGFLLRRFDYSFIYRRI